MLEDYSSYFAAFEIFSGTAMVLTASVGGYFIIEGIDDGERLLGLIIIILGIFISISIPLCKNEVLNNYLELYRYSMDYGLLVDALIACGGFIILLLLSEN